MNLDREKFFISLGTIDQILGPRWAKVSVPLDTDLTLRVIKSFSPGYVDLIFRGKTRFIIFGESPYDTLYNSIARVWMFRSWIVKDSSLDKRSSNDNALS